MNNYAIIPASVRYDKSLGQGAKLLYAELTASSDPKGMVAQDSVALSEILQCDRRTLYRYFKELSDRGHIKRVEKSLWRLPLGFETLSSGGQDEQVDEDTKAFYDMFLARFEKGLNCYLEKRDVYYKTLSERLINFSRDQLMRALENRIEFVNASEWHQKPENRMSTVDITLLIKDDQNLAKWLNMRSERPNVELKPIKFQ